MELLGIRQPFSHFQEEKYQLLELNQRLESYLGRVKLLEQENKILREEIHALKRTKEPPGQRKAQEEALHQARKMKEEAWREKDHAELEVENLMEDLEVVSMERQKVKSAQAEAQRKLAESRKELEEERRVQVYLREKFAHLERELLIQMQVHQENMESLQASVKQTKQVLMAPQPTQTPSVIDLGQEYSRRAAQAWQEATSNYQKEVAHLEESLNQAKTSMANIHQEKRNNQQQVQNLAKELESTKTKREMLEKHAIHQREEQRQELQQLQAHVDTLEMEKESMGQQIGNLMVDRQNLLQVKMSLGLEVATYRALLDGEGLRINRSTPNKTSSAVFIDPLSKSTGTHPASQTTSCHLSSTVSASHRSITSSHSLLTSVTPTRTQSRETPPRTIIRTSVTDEKRVNVSEQTEKPVNGSVDQLSPENVYKDMSLASTLPQTEPDSVNAEPETQPEDSEDQKEVELTHVQAAMFVESKTDEMTMIDMSHDQPGSPSQISETESWGGPITDPKAAPEEDKDEESEVSAEMARISHAPTVAWEESKTIAEDEKEDASEMDVRSENISESYTIGLESDNNTLTSSQVSENTNVLASSLFEQRPLYSVGDFGCKEETNEHLMGVDEQDSVSNISEEVTEPMNSETEATIDSVNEWDRHEENEGEKEEKVMSPDSKVQEEGKMGIDNDVKENNEKEDNNVTEKEDKEREEEIGRDFAEQEGMLPHTESEVVDSRMELDYQQSSKPPTELHYQALNEDHPLREECEGEEANQDDEDDSPNISASWRTDPGEGDSYAQENTLADTRPLIRYKSDEEADMNTQASHPGVSEISDSEEEKERTEGGRWGENISKRFNTMEDLSEEPDIEVLGEMMTKEVVQKDEALDIEGEIMILQGGHDESQEILPMDMVEQESVKPDFRGNHEEVDDVNLRDENLKFDEQKEIPQLGEEQEMYHTEKPCKTDDEINPYDSGENYNIESALQFSDLSSDAPFPETSQQVQIESSFETVTVFQNTMITKEQTLLEEDDVENISMHTHMDLMDSLSLESEINSQPDPVPNSDLEECNSSEDESPNVSQYFQNPTLLTSPALNENALVLGGQSDNNVPEDVLNIDFMEKSTEEHKASQIDDWGNSNTESMPVAAEITQSITDGYANQLFLGYEKENVESSNESPGIAENTFEEHLEKAVEETLEKSVEEPLEKSVEEHLEKSVEEHQEETVEEHLKRQVEKHLEKTVEEHHEETVEEHHEETVEEHHEETVEEHLERPVEEHHEETVQEPLEKTVEEHPEETVEEHNEETVQELLETPVEEHHEKTVEELLEKSVEEHLERTVEETLEKSVEEPLEKSVEEHLEKSFEEHHEETVEEHFKRPVEEHHEETVQELLERTVEEHLEETVEEHNEETVQELLERPVEEHHEKTVEELLEKSVEEHLEKSVEEHHAETPEEHFKRPVEEDHEETVQELLERTVEEHNEETVEEHLEKLVEELLERTVEEHLEKTVEEPLEKLVEEPLEKSVEEPLSNSVEEHLERPVEENLERTVDEHPERTAESFSKTESDMLDIFQRNHPEEEDFQSNKKETEIHSFFGTSLKEDFWSDGKMEMAATYDPAKTENITHDPFSSEQGVVFGEEWRDSRDMPTTNGNPKEEIDIHKDQSQDEKLSEAKQLQYKVEQTRQGVVVLSDDSVDDGDSWSSGDE